MKQVTELAKQLVVSVFNETDTIFNHCMKVRRKIEDTDDFYIEIGTVKLPKDYWGSFHKMLWCKYLRQHSEDLLTMPEEIQEFINFNDTDEGKELSELIKCQGKLPMLNRDILDTKQDIICNLVDGSGQLRKDFSGILFQKYPNIFQEYKDFCECYENPREMLGQSQICESENIMVGNLYCMRTVGNRISIDYEAFGKALLELKEEAICSELSVAFSYGVGASLVGGDWNRIYTIISKVFNNYPIVVYR